MPVHLVISDALHRRVPRFEHRRYAEFQAAAVDVAKGRVQGQCVFVSPLSGRRFYALQRGAYTLYYSTEPLPPLAPGASSVVFEEFLSADEGELILDLFAGWPERPELK
jgi:hypothetical protein